MSFLEFANGVGKEQAECKMIPKMEDRRISHYQSHFVDN